MSEATINGAKIWYEVFGEGEPMLTIHGSGFGHDNFAPIVPYWEKDFQIIWYDMRGYGLSERPIQKYDMEVWADDAVGLLDHLGIEKAHINGTSMGGMIAIKFGAKYPDRILGLVLNCAMAKFDYASKINFRTHASIAEREGMGSLALASLCAVQACSYKHLDSSEGPETVEFIRSILEKNNDVEIFKRACQAMSEMDLIEDLGKITAPTLVYTGDADIMTPVDPGPSGVGTRGIAAGIQNATLVLMPGLSHTTMVEAPEECAKLVTEFLKGVSK
jgi:3-oxoadipate enol-lactonase